MSRSVAETTIADVLGDYIAVQCEVALSINSELEAALGVDRDDAQVDDDHVHDARVACRRLRSIIRVFGDVFSVPEAGRLSDDARWYAQVLGGIRDLDVLGDRIADALEQLDDDLVLHDAATELQRQLADRRRTALAELRDAIHTELYADLTQQLREWQIRPPWTLEADLPATKLKRSVRKADRSLAKRLHRAAAAISAKDPEADELIHAARKAAKRHRYALEAAAPVLGPVSDKLVAERRALQDLLGDYQDSRLASELLRDLGGIPGRNGFTFGLLFTAEAEHRRKLRKQIVKRAR
ncbi:MAG: CHAD domain-containing protein [Microlunatus sp.]|nr:CHAD domain-containing protein [Microlunatus sp.]